MPESVTRLGDRVFRGCNSLLSVHFKGDRPTIPALPGTDLFEYLTTIYYLPGTLGWGTSFNTQPTAPWLLSNPIILHRNPSFGVRTNAFGFRVSWATNISVVVEASANLTTAEWAPVSTNSLSSGWFDFSDPAWTNFPNRIYRVRKQ